MREFLSQGDRLAAPLESLVWIAENPQEQAAIRQASQPLILAVKQNISRVLLGIVQGQALLKVRLS
jgi:hypothetical protein